MKTTSAAKISLAALTALGGVTGFVHDLHAAVVINEVYGGGGSGATTGLYNTDYVELYNNGTEAADLTGLVLKYGSATGVFPTTGTNNITVLPTFSLAPGAFYLIGGTTGASFGGPALPTVNLTGVFSAGASAGKFGLFQTDGTTALDIVAYGPTTTGGEGLPTAALSTTLVAFRTLNGVDTNINAVDFTVSNAATPGASNLPEPAALGLAAVGSALALRRRKAR
jgi:MYXO-CTERM domain-containing protein